MMVGRKCRRWAAWAASGWGRLERTALGGGSQEKRLGEKGLGRGAAV